jgi:hypothetical protein
MRRQNNKRQKNAGRIKENEKMGEMERKRRHY